MSAAAGPDARRRAPISSLSLAVLFRVQAVLESSDRLRQMARALLASRALRVVTHAALRLMAQRWVAGPRFDPTVLAQAIFDGQVRRFARGIGGIAFAEPDAAGAEARVDRRKVAAFLELVRRLNADARARLLRGLAMDTLNGIDKARALERLSTMERWRAALKIVYVAPFERCNLRCVGCWVRDHGTDTPLPSAERLDLVVEQARHAGAYYLLVTGRGEPFFDRASTELTCALLERHPDVRFTILTNATRLEHADVARLARAGNAVLLVSLDGLERVNDARRGPGVFARVAQTCAWLREQGLVFGFSTMAYRDNWRHVTSDEFVDTLTAWGHCFGVYCRYDPIGDARVDARLRLSPAEEEAFRRQLEIQNARADIALRDLEQLDHTRGCGARKGSSIFIDVRSGLVSPCFKTPWAPAACDLFAGTHPGRLVEILGSDFFRRYRAGHAVGHDCFATPGAELRWFAEAPEIEPHTKCAVLSRLRQLPLAGEGGGRPTTART